MKKVLIYILFMSWLFAGLDWKVIHLTRWSRREWLNWMHAHETTYVWITRPLETVLCTPCMALKPIWLEAFKRAEASREEQASVTHSPSPTVRGFYHLPVRGESWTFVPWTAWILVWLPPSMVWFIFSRKVMG